MKFQRRMMNETVTIETDVATTTDDAATDYNERIEKWVTYCKRSAEVLTPGGREFFRAAQLQADLTHIVRLHHDSLTKGITPAMRVKWGSRTLGITSAVEEDNAGRWIVLSCAEQVTV